MAYVKRRSLISSPVMERPVTNFVSPLLRGQHSLGANEFVSEIEEIIDDAAEIKKRQIERVAEVMQTNIVNSPSTPNERQTSIPLSNFTTKNLMDHYAECIRLSTENKITMRNAFSLHLIDYMSEMFNNKDATDFQLASSTLDASAKIYSCRVDIIHSDMYKLLTGLGRGWNKNETANDDDDKDEDILLQGEDGQKKSEIEVKKKKINKGKTIETNLKNIIMNKNDQLNALDPIIAKTINDFNIGSCGGILLNRLHMYSDLPELVILPTSIAEIRNSYAKPKNGQLVDVEEIINFELNDKRIRTTLADINFGEFTEEESKKPDSPTNLRFNLEVDYEEPDKFREDENNHDINDEGFGGMTMSGDENDEANLNTNGFEQAEVIENTIANFKKGNMENLLQAIGSDHSEYAYFKTDFLQMWAGPTHWKLKSRKAVNNSTSAKISISKKLKKQEIKLDLSEDDELSENKLKETKAAIIVTRNTLLRHNDKNNMLPDVKYDGEDLLRNFDFLECAICRRDNMDVPMVNFDNYDYDNAADQLDYCAPAHISLNEDIDNMAENNSYDDVLDFNLTANTVTPLGEGGENNPFVPMDAIFEEDAEVLEGDKLIAPIRKIAKVTIDYARVSKRIDVRILKQTMWHLIEKNIGKLQTINTPLKNDLSTCVVGSNILMFHDLLKQLIPRLPSPTRENISVHIAFVCLLHLANEHDLKLAGLNDHSDIEIQINQRNLQNDVI